MKQTQIRTYQDSLDYMSRKQLREEAQSFDHDCKASPDSGCSFCGRIYEADTEELKRIIMEVQEVQ